MKTPLITIAIPAYNNEKSIEKTLQSCVSQETDTIYEVLVLDDASTDSTPEIVNKYMKEHTQIRMVTLDERVPLIENHNMCLRHAKGEYILFCHADDALETHAVQTFQHKLAARHFPEKYVVWGHSLFRDFSKKALEFKGFAYNIIISGEYAPILFFYGGLTPSGTLYSRESFLACDGYIHTDMNASPSDMTTMIHLALQGFRFEMMDEMVFVRQGSSTALADVGLDGYLAEVDDAFKFFIEEISIERLKSLLTLAIGQAHKPWYFIYAMAQDRRLKPIVKRIVMKQLLLKPWELRNPVIRKLLQRIR